MQKILAIGDAGCHTGFSRVLKGVMDYLYGTGRYDVAVRAINYMPNHGQHYDYEVLPIMGPESRDPLGTEEFVQHVEDLQPDVLWIVQDLWNLGNYLIRKPRDLPSVVYFPVDCPNLKWGHSLCLGTVNEAVSYTQFGAHEAAASVRDGLDMLRSITGRNGVTNDTKATWVQVPAGSKQVMSVRVDQLARWQNPGNWNVIPHGLDLEAFGPRDRAECRKLFSIPEDAFVLGCVSTNQFRKRLDITIRAFAYAAERIPNAVLMMHCMGAARMAGWDLEQLAQYYGVQDRVLFVHKLVPVLTEEGLVNLYNCFDAHINTSGGEGYGLCLGPDALVHTDRGPVPINEVTVEDEVLTESGQYRAVLATTSRTVNAWHEVKIQGHLALKVTPEHPFLVIQDSTIGNVKTRKTQYTPKWTPASELKHGDYVAVGQIHESSKIPTHIDLMDFLDSGWQCDEEYVWHPTSYSTTECTTSIATLMQELGESKKVCEKALAVVRRNRYVVSPRVLRVVAHLKDCVLAKQKKYKRYVCITDDLLSVIGWYLAEGSHNGNEMGVTWDLNAMTEREQGARILDVVESAFGYRGICRIKDPGTKLAVSVSGRPVAAFFTALCGSGASNKMVSSRLPIEDPRMIHLWRGYAQGDGHVTSDRAVEITSVSKRLLLQMQLSLRSMGIQTTVLSTKAGAFHLSMGRGEYSRFANIDYLGRRHNTLPYYEGYRWARVKKNTVIHGELDVYDIAVDTTHSFVANNVIVHNTSFESAACGTPQLVPDWSGTRELWKDHGILLPILDYRTEPKGINTMHALVDVKQAGEQIVALARSAEQRQHWGQLALENAAKQLPWWKVGAAFDELIQRALNASPSLPMSFDDIMANRVGECKSELAGLPVFQPTA